MMKCFRQIIDCDKEPVKVFLARIYNRFIIKEDYYKLLK